MENGMSFRKKDGSRGGMKEGGKIVENEDGKKKRVYI